MNAVEVGLTASNTVIIGYPIVIVQYWLRVHFSTGERPRILFTNADLHNYGYASVNVVLLGEWKARGFTNFDISRIAKDIYDYDLNKVIL